MSLRVICFDPGDHTGWIFRDSDGKIYGGTIFNEKDIRQDTLELRELLHKLQPDVIVYETFHLYPGAAKHLTHNEFYPVQMIGVIQAFAFFGGIPDQYIVRQAPSVKKFSGGLDDRWRAFCQEMRGNAEKTEHTKDAYLHLKYYEMFNEPKLK